jgi:hypothetical protein
MLNRLDLVNQVSAPSSGLHLLADSDPMPEILDYFSQIISFRLCIREMHTPIVASYKRFANLKGDK